MDPAQRERLIDDLKGLVQGELLFDDLSCALYSTDASIFEVQPAGVVVPRDEEDVCCLVRYAAEHHISLIPRGGGSGLAGESLGVGLIVDFAPHFRSILEIKGDTVRVQPGVVQHSLNAELAKLGRRFAPDPASGSQCTIGGMLATNASGSRALRYGYTRDHALAIRLVLDNGEAVTVGQEPRWPGERTPARLREIISSVGDLLKRNAELIRTSQPKTRFNRCGYLLDGVLQGNVLDLPRLLVGSEGTLGFFTEATLRTVPLPEGRAVLLLGFPNLETTLRAARRSLDCGPVAVELIERRLVTLARSTDEDMQRLIPGTVETALLIEFESDTPLGAARVAAELAEQSRRSDGPALLATWASEPADMDRLWRLRELALPSLYNLGGAQPVPFIEDVGVPAEQLPIYLYRVQEVLQRNEITASFFIHAATGQVHTRPFVDLRRARDVGKLWPIAEAVHNLAIELGGTISTQHGTGLARTPWVEKQYGKLYPVFRQVKSVFDPHGIFNPGKIVGPSPDLPAWPLRKVRSQESTGGSSIDRPASEATSNAPATVGMPEAGQRNGQSSPDSVATLLTQLRWKPLEVRNEVLRCNGCGDCRTEEPAQRMCPIARVTHAEAASPRAKANLMRHLLMAASDQHRLSAADVREVADLCVNCKMCAHECPAHVNIPKLMLEAKAANTAEYGLDRTDWVLARTETFAQLGSAFAIVANRLLTGPVSRWIMEKFFGVSRQRTLPRFSSRSFLRRAARRGWTRKPQTKRPRVAYFVDIFANYNDPSIAEATVAVLQHQGIDVYVPPGQRGCGMAPLAYGDVETARDTAQHNLRILGELAREGWTIVCSEPTAALMLTHDYLDLIDDPDARVVAERTVELTAFLAAWHRQGKLKTDFQPLGLSIGHHVPCHLKALGQRPAGPDLLALIPQTRVYTIDVSCSGMAGTFGLKRENYRISLAAGRPMLDEMRQPRILFGSTECSTCRLQIEQGSGKRTLHPAQYLAWAYGLMPGMARRLLS